MELPLIKPPPPPVPSRTRRVDQSLLKNKPTHLPKLERGVVSPSELPYWERVKQISSQLERGTLTVSRRTHSVKLLARGSFRDVYIVTSSGNKYVIKCFNRKLQQSHPRGLENFARNTFKEFRYLQQYAPVEVVQILSSPTTPYIRQTYIQNPVPPLPWFKEPDLTVAELSPLEIKILDQVSQLVIFSLEEEHPIDFAFENFGWNPTKERLLLYDFLETDLDPGSLVPMIVRCLRTWAKGNHQVLKFLVDSFSDANKELSLLISEVLFTQI